MELILFGIRTHSGNMLGRLYQTRQEAESVIYKRQLKADIKEFRVKIE